MRCTITRPIKILFFYHAHEEEQGISFVLELIELVNLDNMQSLVDMLHIDCDRFDWCMVDLTSPQINVPCNHHGPY